MRTAVWAHRGSAERAVENSLEAFADARRLGADGVELDVRRSGDGALVVHHDAAVADLGPISSLTVADLPDHVPLLGAALDACTGLTVNVEIKNDPREPGHEPDQAIAADAAHLVAEGGWSASVVISSFSGAAVDAARAAEPRIPVGLLVAPLGDAGQALERAAGRGYDALHPFLAQVDGALLARARAAGLALHVWVVDTPADLHRVVALGPEAVITNAVADAVTAVSAAGGAGEPDGAEWRRGPDVVNNAMS